MPKMTEAQAKSQAALEAAIPDLLEAYGRNKDLNGHQPILTTYALVTERITLDDDGDDGEVSNEQISVITSHGARLSTTRGLLLEGQDGLVADCDSEDD